MTAAAASDDADDPTLRRAGGVIARVIPSFPGLQPLAGQMASVRFVEQDNLFFFNVTIDNVSLLAQVVPEPSTVVIWSVLGLVGLCVVGQRKRS